MANTSAEAAQKVQDLVREEEEKVKAEEEAAAATGRTIPAPGQLEHAAKSGPTGELVPVDDPRAAAELAEMAKGLGEAEPSVQEVFAALSGSEELRKPSAAESQAAIIYRILSAQSPEEILDQGKPLGAEEIENVPLTIERVRWMKSSFDEGSGVYAVIECIREDVGERVKVTCGGINVLTQLLRFTAGGFLPVRAMIRKAERPTEAGYYPLWLVPAN